MNSHYVSTGPTAIQRIVNATLEEHDWHVAKAARALSLPRAILEEFVSEGNVRLSDQQITHVIGYGYAHGYLQRSEPVSEVVALPEPKSYLVLELPDLAGQVAREKFLADLLEIGVKVEHGECPSQTTRLIATDLGLVFPPPASVKPTEVSGSKNGVPRALPLSRGSPFRLL